MNDDTHPRLRMALTLTLTLAGLGGAPSIAAAAAPEPHTLVELEVDTTQLDELVAERLEIMLEHALGGALQEHGYILVQDGAEATIDVRVAMPNVELRSYALSFALSSGDEREIIIDGAQCLACSEQQFIDRAVELLEVVESRMPVHEAPAPEVEVEVVEACEPTPPREETPPRRGLGLGGLGLAGAMSLAAGSGAVGAGFGFFNIGEEDLASDVETDPRLVARGVIAAGAGVAALGVVMIIIDATVLERRRQRKRIRLSADWSPTSAGLQVTGRF